MLLHILKISLFFFFLTEIKNYVSCSNLPTRAAAPILVFIQHELFALSDESVEVRTIFLWAEICQSTSGKENRDKTRRHVHVLSLLLLTSHSKACTTVEEMKTLSWPLLSPTWPVCPLSLDISCLWESIMMNCFLSVFMPLPSVDGNSSKWRRLSMHLAFSWVSG